MLGTLPLALGILASPIAVIPAILFLLGPRPTATCVSFLFGWTGGLAAVTGVAILFADGIDAGTGKPIWLSWLRIIVGALLLVYGLLTWLRRNAKSEPPRWLTGISELPPSRAAVLGLGLSAVNPKVALLCLSAGLTIGMEGASAGQELVAFLSFLAIGSIEVLLPLGAFLLAGDRATVPLQRVRTWLEDHGTSVVVLVVIVIGALLVVNGVRAL
ncbi:MAG TPA: GAP family protein [Actinomycetota bacterium]|nr:GAP family protein [Actinomycetota bacterium]